MTGTARRHASPRADGAATAGTAQQRLGRLGDALPSLLAARSRRRRRRATAPLAACAQRGYVGEARRPSPRTARGATLTARRDGRPCGLRDAAASCDDQEGTRWPSLRLACDAAAAATRGGEARRLARGAISREGRDGRPCQGDVGLDGVHGGGRSDVFLFMCYVMFIFEAKKQNRPFLTFSL